MQEFEQTIFPNRTVAYITSSYQFRDAAAIASVLGADVRALDDREPAVVMAAAGFAVAGLAMWWFADDNGLLLAGVILMAMVGSCVASGVSGVLVPLGLKRLGADPATASTIFLTTATDVVGMGLMLLLATALVL